MPLPVRRSYKGAPVSTTLSSSLADSAGATSMVVASVTGWPTSFPFFVVIEPGTAREEKVRVTAASGTTLTIVRAQDDTARAAHDANSTVYPVFTATEADEANQIAAAMTTKGDLITTDGTTINRLAVGGTNTHVLQVDSAQTNGIKWGQIATNGITDSAVTTAKIADSAVTSAKIADGTIVDADINASAAIALSKLATGALPTAITIASANIVDGTIVEGDIADSAITSAKIADGTIVNADINASAAIAHSKLANITAGSVLLGNVSNVPTATALSGDVTVDSSGVTAIGSGVIVNADINASAAIALSKLATGALPTAITVASANIVDGTIATADIADGAVTSAKIADGTIATGDIADGAVTSAKIANGTIATADIADGAVTMVKTGIKSGSTVITLSSGVGDVPHGMGTTPSTAVVTNGDHNTLGVAFNIVQIDATNIQIKAIGSTANIGVRVNWIAIP